MKFYPHQMQAYRQLKPKGRQRLILHGLGYGMRDVLDYMLVVTPALVIAPLVLHRQWKNYDEITTPQKFVRAARLPVNDGKLIIVDMVPWRNPQSPQPRLFYHLLATHRNIIYYTHAGDPMFNYGNECRLIDVVLFEETA